MSDDILREAFMGKQAAAPKTNEDDTNKGVNNVYNPPAGRAPGTIDARWGDTPPTDPVQHSTAVKREAYDDRNEQIERLLDSPATSAKAEQNLLSAYLEHASEGHPHSPLLQRGHKTASAGRPASLTDEILRVVGHL